MVLLSRLRQSSFKFHAFSNGSRRFHSLNPAPVMANQHVSSRKLVPILNYPKFIAQDEQLVLFRKVRFFARAIKIKKVGRDENEPRLNEDITAPMVRLVIDEDNHCVIPRHEALARARKLDMDLVEVSKTAKPPVVKIFDYNKQKYIVQTKEKERSKSKVALKSGPPKEIIVRSKITESDLKVKANIVIRLMEKGHRVKCIALDKTESSDLKGLLSKFTALIEDVAVYEGEQICDPKQAFIIARHIKFGPAKSGKKASASAAAASSTSASTDSDSQEGNEIEDGETGQPLESSIEKATAYSDPRPALNKPGPGQRVEAPARGTPKQDSPKPTPPKTYGIFSTPKVNGATNAMNPLPTFPNQGRLGNNASPQTRPEARGTREQDSQPPSTNTLPSFPNEGRPGNNNASPPARGIPKQGSSDSTPPKSYGIFSAPKVGAVDSRTKGGVGGENPGQAKYGIFSGGDKEKPAQRR